jgi:hypothetical protein
MCVSYAGCLVLSSRSVVAPFVSFVSVRYPCCSFLIHSLMCLLCFCMTVSSPEEQARIFSYIEDETNITMTRAQVCCARCTKSRSHFSRTFGLICLLICVFERSVNWLLCVCMCVSGDLRLQYRHFDCGVSGDPAAHVRVDPVLYPDVQLHWWQVHQMLEGSVLYFVFCFCFVLCLYTDRIVAQVVC